MSQENEITSVESLTRAFLFLFKTAAVVFVIALLFVLAGNGEDNSIFSDRNRAILFGPTMLIFFVGGLFLFPIGWFKTVKWMFVMAFNVREDVPAYKYWFNAFNTLFCPRYLTEKGLAARSNLIDALKWAGAGSLMIVLTFAMQYLSGIDA
jgi:hypothetical protein